MSAAIDLIHSFEFSENALVNHRIPKKSLIEHGATTVADKRQINEGIEELVWVAALKPTTIGLATYRDDIREVLEISVLYMRLRPEGKLKRLIELVHRTISYPIILVTLQETTLILSLANKRWSESEICKTVIDGDIIEALLDGSLKDDILKRFRKALALTCQPHNSLYDLYQGWIDTVLALHAASLKGVFAMPTSKEHATDRREALRMCSFLKQKIAEIRAAAAKEKQLSKQVELNLEHKRLQTEYSTACARL